MIKIPQFDHKMFNVGKSNATASALGARRHPHTHLTAGVASPARASESRRTHQARPYLLNLAGVKANLTNY
jgi:hypothetical protein